MSHIHEVKDTDIHYKIDGITRTIVNVDETKRMLVQNDHNSERLTFEVPRYVDGHDLMSCNVVQVHYINSDTYEKNHSSDVYEVYDLHVKGDSEEDKNIVVLSWLVHGNATKYVGTLNFVIRFSCITNGNVVYAWNTTTYKGITILAGIYNSENVAEQNLDVLSYHAERIDNLEQTNDTIPEQIVSAVENYFDENPVEAGATAEEAAQIAKNRENIEKLTTDKLDATKLPEAVNDALAQAKAGGQFDGEDGKTPVKGEDYFTEADKQYIAELTAPLVDVPTDDHINDLINTALGVIENGTY